MAEWRLFPEGTIPKCTTPAWHLDREAAPHLEQYGPQRARLLAALDAVLVARSRYEIRSVIDLGCGDGGLLSILPEDLLAWGYDLCPANVKAAVAERQVDVRYGDVVSAPPAWVEWAELAVCTEMLEHLVDPHAFLARVAKHCRMLVASSSATETDISHYEFHTWAWDFDGYRAMVEGAGWRVVTHEPVSWFQLLMAIRD